MRRWLTSCRRAGSIPDDLCEQDDLKDRPRPPRWARRPRPLPARAAATRIPCIIAGSTDSVRLTLSGLVPAAAAGGGGRGGTAHTLFVRAHLVGEGPQQRGHEPRRPVGVRAGTATWQHPDELLHPSGGGRAGAVREGGDRRGE